MATRLRQIEDGIRFGKVARQQVGADVLGARQDRDVTQTALGAAVGMSRSQVSLAERGLLDSLTFDQAGRLLAAVGLKFAVRAYPTGEPIRDAPQLALLARLRILVHPTVRWSTEVTIALAGDLRAWDVVLSGPDWRVAVEAETRPRDVQALERRLHLKMRDSGIECVVLVLLDSRANRDLLRDHGEHLRETFPVPGRVAMARLAAGQHPGGSSVVLVATAPSVVARRRS